MWVDHILQDLARSAAVIGELHAALAAARQTRDDLIRTGFVAGCPIHVLADTAGLTGARVGDLLGSPHRRAGRPAKPSNT